MKIVRNNESDEREVLGTFEGFEEDAVAYKKLNGETVYAPEDCVVVESASFRRVGLSTLLDDEALYVVIARYKDNPGLNPARAEIVKFNGSYDDCAAYAERNESPDNPESYYVAEVT